MVPPSLTIACLLLRTHWVTVIHIAYTLVTLETALRLPTLLPIYFKERGNPLCVILDVTCKWSVNQLDSGKNSAATRSNTVSGSKIAQLSHTNNQLLSDTSPLSKT